MAISEEERAHAERLLTENERRLRIRDWQISRHGDDTDPAIILEAQDIRRKIAALKAVLEPELPDEITGLVKRRLEDDYFVFQQLLATNERLTHVEEQVMEVKDRVTTIAQRDHATQLWRLDVTDRLTTSERGRRQGAPLHRWVLVVLSVGVLIAIFVAVFR